MGIHDTKHAVISLKEQRDAAEALKLALQKLPGTDEDTVAIAIEGETNLFEAIEMAVALLLDTTTMSAGLEATIERFQARLHRYTTREEYLRSAIEQAMVIADIKTRELPECTITLARRAPGLVITDEHLIPTQYWKAQDPQLDKRALKQALKDGTAIEGAKLGNGGVSLTVTTK